MDTLEGRDVASCDLLGYFFQTDMEGDALLQINGALTLLLIKLDYKCWKRHLKYKKGKNSVIFVNCDKVLIHDTFAAALLLNKKLVCHLTDWGFKINPYEPCW